MLPIGKNGTPRDCACFPADDQTSVEGAKPALAPSHFLFQSPIPTDPIYSNPQAHCLSLILLEETWAYPEINQFSFPFNRNFLIVADATSCIPKSVSRLFLRKEVAYVFQISCSSCDHVIRLQRMKLSVLLPDLIPLTFALAHLFTLWVDRSQCSQPQRSLVSTP